jgi:hypothetical protein
MLLFRSSADSHNNSAMGPRIADRWNMCGETAVRVGGCRSKIAGGWFFPWRGISSEDAVALGLIPRGEGRG